MNNHDLERFVHSKLLEWKDKYSIPFKFERMVKQEIKSYLSHTSDNFNHRILVVCRVVNVIELYLQGILDVTDLEMIGNT